MRVAALLLALTAALVTTEAHPYKLLPAMRESLSLGSSLLRQMAAVKDRLREDVERELLRHAELQGPGHEDVFELPSWNKDALQRRPWASPAFHSSFSYQASSNGVQQLPPPFLPRPRPSVVVVPCRDVRTHIAHFVLPCVNVAGEFERPAAAGLGASRLSNVTKETSNVTGDGTTSDPAPRAPTSTLTYETDTTEQYVTDVATLAVTGNEETTSTPTIETTAEFGEVAATPSELASDVTATDAVSSALGTRADDVTTVTDSPDVYVTTGPGYDKHSVEEPSTLDGKANEILDDDEQRATTTGGNARETTEQPTSSSTDGMNFNEFLKHSKAAFAKLSSE